MDDLIARVEYAQKNGGFPALMDLISVEVQASGLETLVQLIMPAESGY